MSRGNPLVQYLVIKNGSTSALAVDLWTLVASGKWNSYAQFSRHIVSGKFGKCQEGDLTVRRNSIFAVVVKRHQNTEGRVRLDLLHNSAATSHGKKYDKRATAALCQDTCKNSNSKHCVNHSHVVSHEHDLKCGKMYSERLPSQPSLAQIAFGQMRPKQHPSCRIRNHHSQQPQGKFTWNDWSLPPHSVALRRIRMRSGSPTMVRKQRFGNSGSVGTWFGSCIKYFWNDGEWFCKRRLTCPWNYLHS